MLLLQGELMHQCKGNTAY